MSAASTSPMFPLGSVLLPTAVLPLHIFEPRYRELMRVCMAGDRRFGVTLIERGSEVGGGEIRFDVGTLGRIVEAHELDDGRWAVIAVGETRIRVVRWLEDDPYPRAEIEPWPEPRSDRPLDERYDDLAARLRRVLGLATELGDAVPEVGVQLSDDPEIGAYQVAALAPLGSLDRQRVLEVSGTDARIDLVDELLGEVEATLRARIAME